MAAATEALPSLNELMGPLKPLHDPIPNHLTETRIFSHVQDHHLLKVRPRAVHFEGYKVGKLHQQTLHLVNGSTDSISLHIIPPTTKFFKITYSKQNSKLMSGLSLAINIQFKPDQWKYYYDCIRVHCKGNDNLLIPIHGYPAMSTSSFPRSVTFPPTPIGQTKTHQIFLESNIPVEFEYQLTYEQTNSSFTVTPMKGVIQGNNKAGIRIVYTPTEFATVTMKLKLEISQFNSKPLYCTFTGSSTPGLAVQQYKEKQKVSQKTTPVKTTPIQSTPLKKERKKKLVPKQDRTNQEVIYEGMRFPPNLYTPSAVAKVLNQEPGKMNARELREAKSSGQFGGSDSRQLKEAVFLQRVKERVDKEEKNRLSWVKHVGDDEMSDDCMQKILETRNKAMKMYQIKCDIPETETSCNQFHTVYSQRRTRRILKQQVGRLTTPSFDIQSNNLWDTRQRANQRFIIAIRTIITRNRCYKNLKKLRTLIESIKNGQDIVAISPATNHPLDRLMLSLSTLTPYTIPQYKDTSIINSLTTNAPVPTKMIRVITQPHISLMELRVPEQYKTVGYSKLLVPSKDCYTLPNIDNDRPLLSGAKEEYLGLTLIPGIDPRFLSDEFEEVEEKTDTVLEDLEVTGVVPLVPPPVIFHPPSLWEKIHNPSPGVIDGLRPMIPNSEVTFEHVLLPLPSPTAAPHPHPTIDPIDGIPELMKWKQFKSPFLSSCEERLDLVSSWRPVLNDPYLNDLLPLTPHPHQLTGPQDGDPFDNSVDEITVPSKEMLNKEFYLPATDGSPLSNRMDCERTLLEQYKDTLNEAGQQHEEKYMQLVNMMKSQQ